MCLFWSAAIFGMGWQCARHAGKLSGADGMSLRVAIWLLTSPAPSQGGEGKREGIHMCVSVCVRVWVFASCRPFFYYMHGQTSSFALLDASPMPVLTPLCLACDAFSLTYACLVMFQRQEECLFVYPGGGIHAFSLSQ